MQTKKDPSKTTWIGIDVAKNSFVAGISVTGVFPVSFNQA